MFRWSSPQEVEDAEIEVEADEPFDVEKLIALEMGWPQWPEAQGISCVMDRVEH